LREKDLNTTPAEEHCGAGGQYLFRQCYISNLKVKIFTTTPAEEHCGASGHEVHDGKEIEEKALSL
jgi:hypothetical protein